jgi:mannose-6-phosphate isomerase-like protein (cupin superfamily)
MIGRRTCKNYGMETKTTNDTALQAIVTNRAATHYNDATAYVTKDGSTIRELMHPNLHDVRNQSFAEAIVEAGATTARHFHKASEEIYHITQGVGMMHLGAESFAVSSGDTIVIAPGTHHNITNTGDVALKILCACAPAYAHEDTELV